VQNLLSVLSLPTRGRQTRSIARRTELPGGGNSIAMTEDVRNYAAEQAISEEETLAKGMAKKSKEFVGGAGGGLQTCVTKHLCYYYLSS